MPGAPGDIAPALLHGLLGVGCGRFSDSTLCKPVTPPPDWKYRRQTQYACPYSRYIYDIYTYSRYIYYIYTYIRHPEYSHTQSRYIYYIHYIRDIFTTSIHTADIFAQYILLSIPLLSKYADLLSGSKTYIPTDILSGSKTYIPTYILPYIPTYIQTHIPLLSKYSDLLSTSGHAGHRGTVQFRTVQRHL